MYQLCDIDKMLGGLCLIVDSREQPTTRARERYNAFPASRRDKLDFGDYSAEVRDPDGEIVSLRDAVVIERKMSLDELCQCFTHDRGRFEREFQRARNVNAKVYLLIENATMENAYNGRYRSKMNPASLIGSLFSWLARYNIVLLMCKEETSGRLIYDVLRYEMRHYLEIQTEGVSNGNIQGQQE